MRLSEIFQQRDSVAQAHRENMRRSLQHRLEVARAKGDQALIELLEQERRQIG